MPEALADGSRKIRARGGAVPSFLIATSVAAAASISRSRTIMRFLAVSPDGFSFTGTANLRLCRICAQQGLTKEYPDDASLSNLTANCRVSAHAFRSTQCT